jgi:mandelate racemase
VGTARYAASHRREGLGFYDAGRDEDWRCHGLASGASLAEAHGIPISNHLWPELSAQLLCASPAAHFLEYADWWNPIVAEPLRIEAGMSHLGNAYGAGADWNENAIARFAA